MLKNQKYFGKRIFGAHRQSFDICPKRGSGLEIVVLDRYFPPFIFLEQNEGDIGMVTDYRTCPEKCFPAVPRAQIEKSLVTETSGKWWFKVILLLLALFSGCGSYNLPQQSLSVSEYICQSVFLLNRNTYCNFLKNINSMLYIEQAMVESQLT